MPARTQWWTASEQIGAHQAHTHHKPDSDSPRTPRTTSRRLLAMVAARLTGAASMHARVACPPT